MRPLSLAPILRTIVIAAGSVLTGGVGMAQSQERELAPPVLRIDPGISINLPPSWQRGAAEFTNAAVLLAPPATATTVSPSARTVVTVERQKDHHAAVHQLSEIAREVSSTPHYRAIGGWPGLERRHLSPSGQPGQRGLVNGGDLIEHLTTAVAADDLLVRIETTLSVDARSPRKVRAFQRRLIGEAVSIGRRIEVQKKARSDVTADDIELLRSLLKQRPRRVQAVPPKRPSAAPKENPSVKAAPRVALGLHLGELEIAASSSGRDIVIAANSGYAVSNDGGQTFQANPLPHPVNVNPKGDPTVAVGMSGAFYLGHVAISSAGCSIAVSKSSDNGKRFDFLGHAALCRTTERCFPDQGHLAVDPANSGVGGEDQLYLVYRQCSGNANPTDPGQSPCSRETASCRGQPSLVCSPDGGKTWGARTSIGSLSEIETAAMLVQNSSDADFPRVAVGADGIVYVVFRNGHQLQLSKYSSCTAGLRKLGPTITIPAATSTPCPDSQLIDRCHCPVPGLDRCNVGNLLSSPSIAVDKGDPARLYVGYTRNTSMGGGGVAANDDVVVQVSTDRGATWSDSFRINGGGAARRFLPWLCAGKDGISITWYDRSAASKSANDLTDFYIGTARFEDGALMARSEINLTNNPDPQCEGSAWPRPPRTREDATSCSKQPQLAGLCLRTLDNASSGIRCDLRSQRCSTGETCSTGLGRPKYGDYNGVACAAGKTFAAWASGVAPRDLAPNSPAPSDGKIRIYSATIEDAN